MTDEFVTPAGQQTPSGDGKADTDRSPEAVPVAEGAGERAGAVPVAEGVGERAGAVPVAEGAGEAGGTTHASQALPEMPFSRGDTVEGYVVKVDAEGAVVDLGTWIEGFVASREISRMSGRTPDEVVCVGERVRGLVTTTAGPDGRPRVSPARLEAEEAWRELDDVLEGDGDGVVRGTVVEAVKGGLRLDAGVEAFMPASLIELHPVSHLDQYVGRELDAKVIETDRRRYKIVVSRRALLEAERKEKREEVFAALREGEVVTGTVSSVTGIGAFVDVGGADGLLHVTEFSWGRVDDPNEFVKPGDEVRVKVVGVDRDRHRISLSMKQAEANPWDEFVRTHRVGEVVGGKVVKLVKFGAFVEVAPGVEGLVHISEIAGFRIDKPEDHLQVDAEVQVRVLDIDAARRRLSLSIRAVEEPSTPRPTPGAAAGPARGRKKGRGGRRTRTYSLGEAEQAGLSASISSESQDALSELKAQLSGAGDDGQASEESE